MSPTQPKSLNKKHVARLERERELRRYLFIAVGVITVIVVGLILFGYYQTQILPPTQPVALVEGQPITTKEFQNRVRFERNRLVNQFMNVYQTVQAYQATNPDLAKYFQQNMDQIKTQLEPATMGEQVLERMVREILIQQEAVKRGVTVSDAEIQERIQQDFGYNPGGPTATPTEFPTLGPTSTLSVVQMTLVPQYTAMATVEPSATATSAVTETPTLVPSPTVVPSITPTATPYTKELFETDYKETLTRLKTDIDFSEADMSALIRRDIYRSKLYDLMTADLPKEQEQVWARHILVADEETAKKVEEELKTNPDWKALAAKYSTDPGSKDNGGDVGWFSKGAMVPEFDDAVFKLAVGEISAPVKTQYGYHIIQALGHETRPISSYEYQQLQQKTFQDWVEARRKEANVQLFDIWKDRIPVTPDIPEGLKNLPTEAPLSAPQAEATVAAPQPQTTATAPQN